MFNTTVKLTYLLFKYHECFHLFQAMEFVDRPVSKSLVIFWCGFTTNSVCVCVWDEQIKHFFQSFLHKTQNQHLFSFTWYARIAILIPRFRGLCQEHLEKWLPMFVILGDQGAASRDDAIFLGKRYFRAKCLSPKNITSSRLVAPGSPRMRHSALEINFRPEKSLAQKYRIIMKLKEKLWNVFHNWQSYITVFVEIEGANQPSEIISVLHKKSAMKGLDVRLTVWKDSIVLKTRDVLKAFTRVSFEVRRKMLPQKGEKI